MALWSSLGAPLELTVVSGKCLERGAQGSLPWPRPQPELELPEKAFLASPRINIMNSPRPMSFIKAISSSFVCTPNIFSCRLLLKYLLTNLGLDAFFGELTHECPFALSRRHTWQVSSASISLDSQCVVAESLRFWPDHMNPSKIGGNPLTY